MRKKTKYNKRIKITYAVFAALSCYGMLLINPVVSDRGDKDGTFYTIVINGHQEGTALEEATANDIVREARKKLASESQDLVYMDYDVQILAQKKLFGSIDSIDSVTNNVYNELKKSIVATKQKAYTVKIDDFSITLRSKDEVIQLLEAAKGKYDVSNEFSIDLVAKDNQEMPAMEPSIYKMDKSQNQTEVVGESAEGSVQQANIDPGASSLGDLSQKEDGIVSIGFEEDIEVAQTYADAAEIMDINAAIDMVTKEKETNKIYEVVSGDCLSIVAEKNNTTVEKLVSMNELLEEDATIRIGDELIVTVPEPELSVLVTEQATYEEDYELPVQYVDNDNWYTNQENVIQEGSTGHREVTAKITSRNGEETNREVVKENVMTEAVPTIIEKGTQEPPSYIKPLSGGRMTSGFGKRWGRMHEGIDWACPVGTAIKASCAGEVVSAGWSNGYGYCVTIRHSDGKQTRYGHLSKILVSAGEKVTQGEKIALSGNTGRSTGPHVHFEIIVNGNQVNPLKYLN
jgi:murein DD-endopeptidase MepM/ murein hydrolase activator NlpD